jgi:protein-S-isoprenylcysteine O-methyltransferase Ste14
MDAVQVKVPPIVVALLTAACMWFISMYFPYFAMSFPARKIVAAILSIGGGLISVAGIVAFRLAQTTINPLQIDSISHLVVSGIYSFTRNPMYLGLLFVLLGWFVFLSNSLALIMIPLFVLYLNYFQIKPEEHALESKFGQPFLLYKTKVRRWL